MALSGNFTGSTSRKYVQPKITWSATQSISGNYSDVTATLTYSRTNSGYTTSGTWSGGITINGTRTAESKYLSITQDSNTFAVSATTRVYHNADGTKSINISADGSIPAATLTYTTCSATVTLNQIPRQATIKTVPESFTDESSPKITFNNPAGSAVTIKACISWTGADDIAYRTLTAAQATSGEYTFTFTKSEKLALQSSTTKAKSRSVTFYITTFIGNSTYYSTLSSTLTIANCTPTISPTVQDYGDTSYSATGDRNKLLRYFNYPKITFNETGYKGATIVSKKVTCGRHILHDDGYMNNVDNNTFVFTVTDSRGYTVTKTITTTMIDYIIPTCNTSYTTDLDATTNKATIRTSVSGRYYKGSLGAKDNTLTLQYRRKIGAGSYSSWTAVTPTIGTDSYSATVNITGLEYTGTCTFQFRAKDLAAGNDWILSTPQVAMLGPVFDWGENDFAFNVPSYHKKGLVVGDFDGDYEGHTTDSVQTYIYGTTGLCVTDGAGGQEYFQVNSSGVHIEKPSASRVVELLSLPIWVTGDSTKEGVTWHASSNTITLNDSLTNYSEIEVVYSANAYGHYKQSVKMRVNYDGGWIVSSSMENILPLYNGKYITFKFPSYTTIKVQSLPENAFISRIYGWKW